MVTDDYKVTLIKAYNAPGFPNILCKRPSMPDSFSRTKRKKPGQPGFFLFKS